MTLQVDVLGVVPLPEVRLMVSDVPSGRSWKVTGTAGDYSWVVAEARSDGNYEALVDPWAPLGVPVSYELTFGGVVQSAGPVTRVYGGQHVITDLDGSVVVDFLWDASGGDSWAQDPRAEFVGIPGAYFPSTWSAPSAGAGGGSLLARTTMPHTQYLRDLVRANRPLILFHNADRCPIQGCDVPPVRTVSFTGVGEDRTGRKDVAERAWSLSYRLVG